MHYGRDSTSKVRPATVNHSLCTIRGKPSLTRLCTRNASLKQACKYGSSRASLFETTLTVGLCWVDYRFRISVVKAPFRFAANSRRTTAGQRMWCLPRRQRWQQYWPKFLSLPFGLGTLALCLALLHHIFPHIRPPQVVRPGFYRSESRVRNMDGG